MNHVKNTKQEELESVPWRENYFSSFITQRQRQYRTEHSLLFSKEAPISMY